MSRYFSGNIKAVLLIVGIATASFAQTDWVASVIPPGVLFEALAINHDLPTKARPKYNSTTDLAVSPDKKMLFVAQQTAKRIDIVDITTETVTNTIRLPNEVTGIAVSPDGDLLYATCSSDQWPAGMVCVIDIPTMRVAQTVAAGYGARAPVVTPDGLKLFVCNRFSNDLSIIDLASRSEMKRLKMVREPYCAAVTPDGKTVIVGNLLSDDRSTDTAIISGKVTLVNAVTLEAEKDIRLHGGSTGLAGIAVSPDGTYAFIVHTIERFAHIGTTCEKGWMNQNQLSMIDLRSRQYFYSVTLDNNLRGAANPWDIAVTDDQRYLCITHAGSHELSFINYPAFTKAVEELNRQGETLIQDFSLLTTMRRSVKIAGRSPRTLAVIDSTVYTAGFFDDEGAAIQKCIIAEDTIVTTQFQVGPQVAQTVERQGEAYFYDASLCFQGWQSCHTCHQFTRASGFNRILGGGAITSPKNTKSMLHTWWTPPYNWSGRRKDAHTAISFSIELELFKTPLPAIENPLDTFIMNIKPVASPHLDKGRLSEAAARGKSIFFGERAKCFQCHSAPLFTDLKLHDAGVPDPYDETTAWDTPSLIEAWRTGPYGHLGSFRSVREIVELPGHNDAHSNLSTTEMDDLVEYVLSL